VHRRRRRRHNVLKDLISIMGSERDPWDSLIENNNNPLYVHIRSIEGGQCSRARVAQQRFFFPFACACREQRWRTIIMG